MEQRAIDAVKRPEPEPNHYEPHMLDARIGEHPLHVVLGDEERHGEHDGKQSEEDKVAADHRRAEHRAAEDREPHEGIQRTRHEPARKHGADRRRRLAVGPRFPPRHRHEPGLGAVAQKQEQKGEFHGRRIDRRGACQQRSPAQAAALRPARVARSIVREHRAEERKDDADRADQQIPPGRLDRFMPVVKTDHQGRGQSGGFDRHPHDADVVRQH